jgi:AcrR family transcriptional regulator
MSKGQATKASILDEALQVASTVGFEALSIGQLAERAEMSKSGLFAHFRSKEQLQLQALDHAAAWFTDAVVRPTLKASRGEPRVRELFERWLVWETEVFPGGCVFIAGSNEYDDQPGLMHDAVVNHQRDWAEFITTVAGTAVSEGHFRPDLDTGQFTFLLQGLMLGYHHAARLLRDPRAVDRTRSAFEQLLASSR